MCIIDCLSDVSNVRSRIDNVMPSSHSTASEATLVTRRTPKSIMHKHYSLVVFKEKHLNDVTASKLSSPLSHSRSRSLLRFTSLGDVKLKQFSFKCDGSHSNREVLWIQLACTLIKNLVYREASSSGDLYKCRCLQMALRATKVVDSHAENKW